MEQQNAFHLLCKRGWFSQIQSYMCIEAFKGRAGLDMWFINDNSYTTKALKNKAYKLNNHIIIM